MQYLQRSTKQAFLQLLRNWQSYFTLCGEKNSSPKNSRMQQLFTYSNGKWILKSVKIPLLSNAWKILAKVPLNQLNEPLENSGLLPEANLNSGKTDKQFTSSSQQDSFKRNVRNKMRTSTWPLWTLLKHLTQSRVNSAYIELENSGKVWLSGQIYGNVAAVPRWYACKCPK